MAITPEQARAELARRELARRQEGQEPEDNENLLQKVMKYGVKDPAIGLLNMGREFANLGNKISGGWIPELSPSEFNFGETLGVKDPNTIDKIIQFSGQYAPSLAIPGVGEARIAQAFGKVPAIGKLLSNRFVTKAASEAIPQAAYAATQAPQDAGKSAAETGAVVAPFAALSELFTSPSKKIRTAAKIIAAGGAGLLGREGAKSLGMGESGSDLAGIVMAALGARKFTPKSEQMEKLVEGVHPGIAEDRLKAAKRLGLDYLTPAEAGVSPWAARRQGGLGRTEEGAKMIYERGKLRQASEREAIGRTLNKIYSPGAMDEKITQGYKSLNEANLPQEFPRQFENNAIIQRAERMVKSKPAYQESLKELLPENAKLELGQSDAKPTSLVYWDHVKRALDDMVETAERTGNRNEARIISDTRAKMRDQMDASFPEYAETRALYERKMVRQSLEKVFDQKEINGTNFYRALASEKKFDELIGKLKNAPDAVQNLKDMRMLFKDLMPPPTIKTAKGTEERGMNQSRSTGAFLENLLEHVFTKGGDDVAAVKFITSKDWLNQMKELEKISDKQLKLAALSMMLTKGVGQYAGQQEQKPLELEMVGGHR